MQLEKIGRYEIKSEIGRGGMATVYRAYDPRFERDVALKVLPRELLHDGSFHERFEQEAKIVATLEHPAIVPVYDVGEEDGLPYLVMRLMTGGSLSDIISKGPMRLKEVVRIMNRLGPALDEVHAKGIIHRDLKPGNILFDRVGESYIVDFGIAKIWNEDHDLDKGSIIGTPAYMSPEQAQGDPMDGRTDVYALGVIFYEMLTGMQPYIDETPMGVVVKHITDPIPNILEANPALPRELQLIIEKVMAKNPDNRFSTAGEFASALQALLPDDALPENVSAETEEETSAAADVIEETEAEKAIKLQAAIAANRLVNNRSQAVFNDRSQGDDQLGIKDEIEALAETLLLRDVEPPVAVGVMGGWGSGKSFVMYLVNQYVQSIRAKKVKTGWSLDGSDTGSETPAFVGHIYQINFNAWTYAKSNLWASLMDTIFLNLNKQMQLERLLAHKDFSPTNPAPTKEQIRESMLAGGNEFKKIYSENLQIDQDKDLKSWRTNLVHWSSRLLKETLLWNIMRGQQVEVLEKLKDTEEQLKQLKQRRAKFQKDHHLREITTRKLDKTTGEAYLQSLKGYLLAFVTDEISQGAKEELSKQGVSEKEIKKQLKAARGLVGGFNALLAAYRRSRIYSIWTLLFLVITLAVPYVWVTYVSDSIDQRMPQAIALLMMFMPALRVLIRWLQKSVKFGQNAKQILEGAYSAQQAKDADKITTSTEKPLPQKVAELQKEIANGSVAAYDSLISLLETQAQEQRQEIGSSAKYANLMEFVQSRLDAATYENQLGLMHQVRQDIDELTYSLVDNADPDVFPRGKPRVILYIDDLDRCPPTRVVEILEAVQLLLSTKLFIVILGLDTRYVTRALEKEYKEILQHEGDPSGLDYIEKIIQIPYRVRPIEIDGLRKYLEKQMDVERPVQPVLPMSVVDPSVNSIDGQAQNAVPVAAQPVEFTQPPTGSAVPTQHPMEVAKPEPKKEKPAEIAAPVALQVPQIELPAAVIRFKPEDLDDLTICCQKIPLTPRSIKRMVNVFKLMKIFWFRASQDIQDVERDQPRAVKQAAIMLLALSSAYPEVMREVFVHLDTLYRQEKGNTALFTAISNIHLPPGSIHELSWQLQKYKADLVVLQSITGSGQDKFAQLSINTFSLITFNMVRSFSFVGDPAHWMEGDDDVQKPKRVTQTKRVFKTKPATS